VVRIHEAARPGNDRILWRHVPEHLPPNLVEAVVGAIARCEAEVGPLTGLVNSAGIGSDIPCLDTTTTLFRKIVEVNLIGSFVVAREAPAACVRRAEARS